MEETGVVSDRGVAEVDDDDDPDEKGNGMVKEGNGGLEVKPLVNDIDPFDPPTPKPLVIPCFASGCEPLKLYPADEDVGTLGQLRASCRKA